MRLVDIEDTSLLKMIADGRLSAKAVWRLIKSQPTVDAVPVRHGKWVYDPNGMDWGLPAWVCSECHQKNSMIPTHIRGKDSMIRVTKPLLWAGSRYCPNCGARMEDE